MLVGIEFKRIENFGWDSTRLVRGEIDEGPIGLCYRQLFVIGGSPDFITPNRSDLFHGGNPGLDDHLVMQKGGEQILDEMAANDPPHSKFAVSGGIPALSSRMGDGCMLQPTHIFDVIDMPHLIDFSSGYGMLIFVNEWHGK